MKSSEISSSMIPKALRSFGKTMQPYRVDGVKLGNAMKTILSCPREETAISFSGGKDSLVILDLAYNLEYFKAVFSDTTLEFKETVNYIKDLKKYYPKLKLEIVKSKMDFFELTKKLGYPSRRYRWCCDVFKFAPLGQYARKNGIKYFLTGLRSTESQHRVLYKAIDNNPLIPTVQVNPIIHWDDRDVWSYIWYEKKLPINPLYSIFDRVGCWCCPYNSNSDWKTISKHFPNKFRELMNQLSVLAKIHVKKEHRRSFLENFGWTTWRYKGEPKKSFMMKLCGSDNNKRDYYIKLQSKEDVYRVERLLPIISTDYKKINTQILVKAKESYDVKVKILAEKAANCIGCGACTLLCKHRALSISKDSRIGYYLDLDLDRCVHCMECLKTTPFRSACISRNYATNRFALVKE